MKTRNTMRLFISISCVLFLFLGCKDTSSTINPDDTTVNDSTFTDIRDNRKYTIVKIGKQVWMSENLQTSTYRNGDPVYYARTNEDWVYAAKRKEGAWCYYDNDEQNGKKYGKLYNWYAVNDYRGLSPKGYHIPSDEEWTVLKDYLGGEQIAGFKMKSTTGWENNGNGDNSSGFNGLPGGCNFSNSAPPFDEIGRRGNWWSSTEYATTIKTWYLSLFYNNGNVYRDNSPDKELGLSVRCIVDTTVTVTVNDSTFTDIRDNRKYTIVKIGKKVWMSENLQTSTYRNGDPVQYARTNEEWVSAAKNKEGAWCYYNNDEQNGKKYGKLYNWYAVNDSRGLSPKGYHIPSDEEWTVLRTPWMEQIAGFKMKSTTGWERNNGNGDNSSGFNGLPGGCNFSNSASPFYEIGRRGSWWSSTEYETNNAFNLNLFDYSGYVLTQFYNKGDGLSVRCLRD